ncbi:MAG: hypothetical protein MPK05_06620, partial [Gammaproteobacteria bacterium]|nr:hypothetical protein [Gammaproteobacteria bacterium]
GIAPPPQRTPARNHAALSETSTRKSMSNHLDIHAAGLMELMAELQRKKPSKSEANRRFSAYHRKQFDEMLEKTMANEDPVGGLPHPGTAINTSDEEEFRAHLKRVDNDLEEMIRIVREGVAHYFENGEYPAPYYAWRIAIILRKHKMHQEEADFLEAFSRLFSDGNGARYQEIAKRAVRARQLAEKSATQTKRLHRRR